MKETFGFTHFLSQGDWATCLVFFVLLGMSLLSWYVIAWKGLALYQQVRCLAGQKAQRLQVKGVTSLRAYLKIQTDDDAFAQVAQSANDCCMRLAQKGEGVGFELAQAENLVALALRQKQAEAMAVREKGLTVLASVASCAPFIGLFGTVWGIYHALLRVGESGQASLDKIAGPVGEALIMTACGLAVAIPALLAYNAYLRANRRFQEELEAWSTEVLMLLATDCGSRKADSHFQAAQTHIQKVA